MRIICYSTNIKIFRIMASTFKLTRREEQVAELLAWGASKKEVPDLLPLKPGRKPIAIRTVENTVRNIYEKLGIQKVNELSAWYFCTHFDISMSLNPLKRKVIAMALLIILLPCEFFQISNYIRPGSNNRTTKIIRYRHRRKNESTCYDYQ